MGPTLSCLTHTDSAFPQHPRREVERIMRYLDLSLSDDVINHIVELTSFKTMKENPMANYAFYPKHIFDQSVSPFMRKGASISYAALSFPKAIHHPMFKNWATGCVMFLYHIKLHNPMAPPSSYFLNELPLLANDFYRP